MTTGLAQIVQMQKAIGHPVRLRILSMLRDGPLCVCQMTVVVKLAASTVSGHLSDLRKAGVIAERKDGRWVEYRLSDNAVAQGVLEAIWPAIEDDPDTKADALVLRELRRVPVEELCGVSLDLQQIDRPRLANAVAKAERLREST